MRRIVSTVSTVVAVILIVGLGPAVAADPPPAAAAGPTLAVGDVTVPEGDTGTTPARLAVRTSVPVAAPTDVRFTVTAGTASADDFRARSGRVRIPTGRSRAVIAVSVLADTRPEPDESVVVTITDPGGLTLADGTGTATIRDDENAAGVAIGDAVTPEGDTGTGLAKLAVVLDAPVATDTILTWTMVGTSATAPDDYRARSGRVRIRAGRVLAVVTPTTFGDTVREPDEELVVWIAGDGGVPIADATGAVTIRDDEPAATPDAPTDLAVVPGPQNRWLTATWSPPSTPAPILGYDAEITHTGAPVVIADVVSPYAFGCGTFSVTATCTTRVRARTAGGDGPWSPPVVASTWAPPAAPLALAPLGPTAVGWSEPPSDRPISHYLVQHSPDGATGWVQDTTTTGLVASVACTECFVRVAGYSPVGLGDWATIGLFRPGPPTDLTAVRDTTIHELVHVTWTPPTSAGPAVTGYTGVATTVVPGLGLVTQPLASVSGPALDEFLRATFTWTIEIRAVNVVGPSTAVTVVLPAG